MGLNGIVDGCAATRLHGGIGCFASICIICKKVKLGDVNSVVEFTITRSRRRILLHFSQVPYPWNVKQEAYGLRYLVHFYSLVDVSQF